MKTQEKISAPDRPTALKGKTVLVTRAAGQAREFEAMLQSLGAVVVEFPTISISDPDSWDEADDRIKSIGLYDGLVFSSANAVDYFLKRLGPAVPDNVAGKIICAVGSKTRDALAHHDCRTDVIPGRFTADDLVAALAPLRIAGKRFLHPRGDRGRDTIRLGLEACGAILDECVVYKTGLADSQNAGAVQAMLAGRSIDLLTFFSPSSVEGFFQAMRGRFEDDDAFMTALRRIPAASIGPVTAESLRAEGIEPAIVSAVSTGEALVDRIVRYFS